jgi:ACS family glucarate transporter-like MFS transporter
MSNPVPSAQRPASPDLGPPSHTRYYVIVFAVVLAVVQYIDRVAISLVEGDIRLDLGLSQKQMGIVFGAFTLAYALFEIPTGYLGDRIGARKVLIRVVLWWSFFTSATGLAWNWISMVTVRFLFGVGEAGCFPNIARAFSRWLPTYERVRAQSILWMSARWGGAITPLLLALLLRQLSEHRVALGLGSLSTWRVAFMLFGLLGVFWCLFFYRWFRDNPADHPKVNAAELALMPKSAEGHPHVPWSVMFSRPSMLLLFTQYFTLSYSWYFFITWFPTYLKDSLHYDLKAQGAVMAGVPLFLGGFGALVGGWITPAVTRMLGGNIARTRSVLGCIGQAMAGACLVAATFLDTPIYAVAAIGIASFFNDLTMPGAWTACMDIGGKFTGTVSGAMNMMGNLGGFVSPIVIGYILDWTKDPATNANTSVGFDLAFYVTGALYMVGAIAWLFIDSTTPLPQDLDQQHA